MLECHKPVKENVSPLSEKMRGSPGSSYLNFLAGARNVRNGYHASTISQEFVWWKVKYRLVALRETMDCRGKPRKNGTRKPGRELSGKTVRRNNFDHSQRRIRRGIRLEKIGSQGLYDTSTVEFST